MFIIVEWCSFSFVISPHSCGKKIPHVIRSPNISSRYLQTPSVAADSISNTCTHIYKGTMKCHWMCRKTHAKWPGSPSAARWRTCLGHHRPVLWRLSRPARSGTLPKSGLNANTVLCIRQTGEDAIEPVGYWHGSPFTRMSRDGTEGAHQKSHSGRTQRHRRGSNLSFRTDRILKLF